MSLGLTGEQVRLLRSLPRDKQAELLAGMSAEELLRLDADFDVWANEGQRVEDDAGWRMWLMMAGRGFGKTRAGAEWVLKLALGRRMRIALVGATMDEARAIMVEGASGVLTLARRTNKRVRFEPSRNLHAIEITLVNSEKWLVSAEKAALEAGANLAAIGDEVVQFAVAEPIATGRFRLSGLRRGLRGSEAATTGHAAGEAFVLIRPDALQVLSFQEAQVGSTALATALGVGNKANPPTVSRAISA